ncbi:MAG: aminodeoxychorismate synthase component I [Thermodesulfobacteriota bacterium]
MEGFALFGWPPALGQGWSLHLAEPEQTLKAFRPDQVLPVLAQVEEAVSRGLWAAVAVSYEAAPAFDPVLRVHAPARLPLVWAALYRTPRPAPAALPSGGYAAPSWEPGVEPSAHARAVSAIRDLIRSGDTYQVNYAIPFTCRFEGSDLAWFADLARAQRAGYASYLDLGSHAVLSLSPELFFRIRGRKVTARPMKGTAARGRHPAEDEARRAALETSAKDRSENVMIVDLLRSDLGRVAEAGSVQVRDLYRVEPYPTVWQMTSTVEARLRPGAGLSGVLAATFPCGSVTGAPKVRTMEIIRDLEPGPRQIYCGAVGYVAPGGDCEFSVPIRTVVLDREAGRAGFWVGGGVTHDSTAAGEYAECLAKMRFLTAPAEDFRLLETLLWERGGFPFLDGHLRRLAASSRYHGFPLDEEDVRRALAAALAGRGSGRLRVRLLLARDGAAEVQVSPLDRSPRPLRVGLAEKTVDSSQAWLFHKTDRRGFYDAALAGRPECDDVLLRNERGELTEACTANLVLDMGGRLLTPALDCGLLPGVYRERLLARGIVAEARLTLEDLLRARRFWLVNALRRWRPARLVLDKARAGRI